MRTTVLLGLWGWVVTASAIASSPGGWMLELRLGDQRIEGTPLAWNARQVHLLGRDGRLWQFAPQEASDYRKTSNRFRGYSSGELRGLLLRQLGRNFEVTTTSHYVVAHPRGQRDRWAERFEELYRSFHHYFSVRGFRLRDPPFPLVGVVCHDQAEFRRLAKRHGGLSGPGVLGYYSLESNRIMLYDRSPAAHSAAAWKANAATIIHEATHQTAFNTGVHSRYAPPPVWVAEGLATLFEAPGVYDWRYHPQRSDRINHGRLRDFVRLVGDGHRPEWLQALIRSDHLFQTAPAVAYAEAWAMTFFLMETRPTEYAEYLARTARRPPFQPYSAAQRTEDFVSVFGSDWAMLEAQFVRFMSHLR